MKNKCECGSDTHSLSQSATCDGKSKYGAEYKAPKKKKSKFSK